MSSDSAAATLTDTMRLGDAGWRTPLLAVEHVPGPSWTEPPPDPAAAEADARAEVETYATRAKHAQQLRTLLGPVVHRAWVALWASLATAGFLVLSAVVAVAAGDSPALFDQQAGATLAAGAAVATGGTAAAMTGLIAAGLTLSGNRHMRTGIRSPRRAVATALAMLAAGFIFAAPTLGLSMIALPGAVGAVTLLRRPVVHQLDAESGDALPSSQSLHRTYRHVSGLVADYRARDRSVAQTAAALLQERSQDYEQRRCEFDQKLECHLPYRPVSAPPVKEMVVVGGAHEERGDLLHHVSAACLLRELRVIVLDLEATGACDRLLAEVDGHGHRPYHVDADDSAAVQRFLEAPTADGQQHLVDAVAAVLADEQGTISDARAARIEYTLHRIDAVFRQQQQPLTTAALRDAVDALLGRTGPAPPAGSSSTELVHDDFGALAASPSAEAEAAQPLAQAVRGRFTADERDELRPLWLDVHAALETLLRDRDRARDGDHGPLLSVREAAALIVTVPARLPRGTRRARRIAALHRCLAEIRADGTGRSLLLVNGAEELSDEAVREAVDVATRSGSTSVMMFSRLTDTARELGRQRAVLGCFGGLGAEASEQLGAMFGHTWRTQRDSYARTWSTSDSTSRTDSITEGHSRNWGRSDARETSRGSSSGSDSSGGSTSSRSTGHSSSHTTSSGESETTSHTTSEGTDQTFQEGGTETYGDKRDTVANAEAVAALDPYLLLLKEGRDVRVVDVWGDLAIPRRVVEAAELAALPAPAAASAPTAPIPTLGEPLAVDASTVPISPPATPAEGR